MNKCVMDEARIDLSVLLIFFARPHTLLETFKSVRQAKPSRLFLFCDGSRGIPEEDKRIEESKKIVENIDWNCEVHRLYSENNLGCGKGPAEAITWAFKYVDKLLILEDDCVANQTLYPFMKEMLEYYEDDYRVGLVSGFNHFKDWNTNGYSYCFTKTGATLGWGTWKRVWDKYDFGISLIKDEHLYSLLKKEIYNERIGERRCREWNNAYEEIKRKEVNYWDIQFGLLKYTQSLLVIVPKGNMICNIGVGVGSTHTANNKNELWKPGKILFMPTIDMSFPIKHPPYVICDRLYDNCVFKINFPNKFQKIKRRLFRILHI